jgi:hypothetical protein
MSPNAFGARDDRNTSEVADVRDVPGRELHSGHYARTANLHADRGMNVLRDPRNDCVMVFNAFAT